MLLNRRQAIHWKYPDLVHKLGDNNNDYCVQNRNDETGEEEFYWYTDKYPKPTDAEMQVWYDDYLVIENRKKEYPSIEDQLDMRFHDEKNGTTIWEDTIQAVKDKYPKS